MGEGDQICEHQAGVIRADVHNVPLANAACASWPILTASEPLATQIYAPESRLLVDFVEKVASLKSLQNYQNTNDIFD